MVVFLSGWKTSEEGGDVFGGSNTMNNLIEGMFSAARRKTFSQDLSQIMHWISAFLIMCSTTPSSKETWRKMETNPLNKQAYSAK